jgi:hypothetical protein
MNIIIFNIYVKIGVWMKQDIFSLCPSMTVSVHSGLLILYMLLALVHHTVMNAFKGHINLKPASLKN